MPPVERSICTRVIRAMERAEAAGLLVAEGIQSLDSQTRSEYQRIMAKSLETDSKEETRDSDRGNNLNDEKP